MYSNKFKKYLLALAFLCPIIFLPLNILKAHEIVIDIFTFEHPWVNVLSGSSNAAMYVKIINKGDLADHIIGASSPAAARLELHSHFIDDSGVSRMRHVMAIDIPPKGFVDLAPGGGNHIMLIGLKGPFFDGELIPISLTLKNSGILTIDAVVESVGLKPKLSKESDVSDANKSHHKH